MWERTTGFKNYIESLLMLTGSTSTEETKGYYIDNDDRVGNVSSATLTNINRGAMSRWNLTKTGKNVVFKGSLGIDFISNLNKYILNGVTIDLVFYQALDKFRLLSPNSNNKYKVQITDMYLSVYYVRLRPELLLSHSEHLNKDNSKGALYPYTRTAVRNFNVPVGSSNFEVNNLLGDRLPDTVIVWFISSTAYNGEYGEKPILF